MKNTQHNKENRELKLKSIYSYILTWKEEENRTRDKCKNIQRTELKAEENGLVHLHGLERRQLPWKLIIL